VRDVYIQLEEQRVVKKSLEAYEKSNAPSNSTPSQAPSKQKRRKFDPIPPEIQGLVAKNVFYEGCMTWDEACRAYDIGRSSISRILQKEKKKQDREEVPAKSLQKRGRKSPLDNAEILVFILMELECNSQLTLKDIVIRVEAKFEIQTSDSAIDRALRIGIHHKLLKLG